MSPDLTEGLAALKADRNRAAAALQALGDKSNRMVHTDASWLPSDAYPADVAGTHAFWLAEAEKAGIALTSKPEWFIMAATWDGVVALRTTQLGDDGLAMLDEINACLAASLEMADLGVTWEMSFNDKGPVNVVGMVAKMCGHSDDHTSKMEVACVAEELFEGIYE